jgi:hypothetical protein
VTNGYNPIRPIYAVLPGSRGDLTLKEGATSSEAIAWSNLRDGPYMATPLLYRGMLYVVSTRGVLTAFEPRTGLRIYQERIAPGGYSASPVAAEGLRSSQPVCRVLAARRSGRFSQAAASRRLT